MVCTVSDNFISEQRKSWISQEHYYLFMIYTFLLSPKNHFSNFIRCFIIVLNKNKRCLAFTLCFSLGLWDQTEPVATGPGSGSGTAGLWLVEADHVTPVLASYWPASSVPAPTILTPWPIANSGTSECWFRDILLLTLKHSTQGYQKIVFVFNP